MEESGRLFLLKSASDIAQLKYFVEVPVERLDDDFGNATVHQHSHATFAWTMSADYAAVIH